MKKITLTSIQSNMTWPNALTTQKIEEVTLNYWEVEYFLEIDNAHKLHGKLKWYRNDFIMEEVLEYIRKDLLK